MKLLTITRLAQAFGLSRSTLLYYDRIGLLTPSKRSEAGYRMYSEKDRDRLGRICQYRAAGLSLETIARLLENTASPVRILEKRLADIGREILELKLQQNIISEMIGSLSQNDKPQTLNKDMWVAMLKAAGMDDRAMMIWHAEFEQRASDEHMAFLISLGLNETEIKDIRKLVEDFQSMDDLSFNENGQHL